MLIAAFIACTYAVSVDDSQAETKVLDSDVRADGFKYIVETSNSISAGADGDEHGNIHGHYEYISPEGEHIKVDYVADENGYQPSSDILPTPPPVPAEIVKALEYLRSHPSVEDKH